MLENSLNFFRKIRYLPRLATQVNQNMDRAVLRAQVEGAVALPSPQKEAALRLVISKLEEQLNQRPDLAYYFHGEIGVCYDALRQREEALAHFEQTILMHPDPDSEGFNTFRTHYLNQARFLTLNAVPNSKGKDKDRAISKFRTVVESTDRILEKYPELSDLADANRTARGWYRSATGKVFTGEAIGRHRVGFPGFTRN